MFRLLVVAWVSLLIVACSASNQVALLRVSQADLDQQLNQKLATGLRAIQLAGIPMQFRQLSVSSEIAPQGRTVVQLAIAADLSAQVAVIELPVELALQVEAEPYFDQSQQAVFLKKFRIVSAKAQGAGYRGQLKPLPKDIEKWLEHWLAKQPVYRLDNNKMEHRLLLNMPLQLQLFPGEIKLTPAFK